jgi:hypothetical protein
MPPGPTAAEAPSPGITNTVRIHLETAALARWGPAQTSTLSNFLSVREALGDTKNNNLDFFRCATCLRSLSKKSKSLFTLPSVKFEGKERALDTKVPIKHDV